MATNYAADLIHYLDDFLLAGPPGQLTCSESTETMLRVCERLGIPVALDNLEGPATTITFLGITINTTLQQLRLPPEKLQDMTLLIKSWLGKHNTTKRDLLSVIGKLSFAAKVVPSGRLFLRRLIELSTTVKLLSRALAPSTFNTYETGIRRYYDFCSTPSPKTTPGHSTNSGTIRDGPQYEPPAEDYPGVYIGSVSVLAKPYERSQESSKQQPNDQARCPRR